MTFIKIKGPGQTAYGTSSSGKRGTHKVSVSVPTYTGRVDRNNYVKGSTKKSPVASAQTLITQHGVVANAWLEAPTVKLPYTPTVSSYSLETNARSILFAIGTTTGDSMLNASETQLRYVYDSLSFKYDNKAQPATIITAPAWVKSTYGIDRVVRVVPEADYGASAKYTLSVSAKPLDSTEITSLFAIPCSDIAGATNMSKLAQVRLDRALRKTLSNVSGIIRLLSDTITVA